MSTLTINLAGTPTPVEMPGGVAAAAAAASAASAATASETAVAAVGTATGAAAAAALDKAAAQTARTDAQTAAASVTADAAAAAAARADAETAQAAAEAVITDIIPIAQEALLTANGSVLIGPDAAISSVGSETGVVIGKDAGKGSGLTAGKPNFIGFGAGENYRGYATPVIGTFAGKDGCSSFAAIYGTHAGQDWNRSGVAVDGFGSFATGTITFTGAGTAGDTLTLAGVAFTAVGSGAAGNQYNIGASAAETAANFALAVLGSASTALAVVGLSRAAAVVTVHAIAPGSWGNSVTLATTAATVALSAATLTGGATTANAGNPLLGSNALALGNSALSAANPHQLRRAQGVIVFSGQPTAGQTFALGRSAQTFTWVASGSGANEVVIGASLPETLANLEAKLNAHANSNITAATYLAAPAALHLIFDANSIQGSEYRVNLTGTPVMTAPLGNFLRGGASVVGAAPVAVGVQAASQALVSDGVYLGHSAGRGSTGNDNTYLGQNTGRFVGGSRNTLIGYQNANYLTLERCIAIGDLNFNGAASGFFPVAALTSDGVVTMASPHGGRVGQIYSFNQRNLVDGALIRRSANGTGTPTNIAATLGLAAIAISPTQYRVIASVDEDGSPDTYSYIGASIANLELARFDQFFEDAIVIGSGATPRSRRATIGGSNIDRINLDAPLEVLGGVSMRSYIGPTAATGTITFSGNPAANDTITLNGVVFTFVAAPNNIRQIRIGASQADTISNVILAFEESRHQSTNLACYRARLLREFNLIRVVVDGDTGGNDYTLAESSSAITVSGATCAGASNGALPTTAIDGEVVRVAASPRRFGQPGLAMFNLAAARWELL